jgi:hypothetical protein
LIFFGPAVLIFLVAAIAGMVTLGLAAKYKQEEDQERETEYQNAKQFEEMMARARAKSWIDELDGK